MLEQPIPWEAVLAERSISVPALLELGVGSVIVLGAADRPAELRAGGADVADGEVVRLEGNRLGVQLAEVRPRREILAEIELDSDLDEDNDRDNDGDNDEPTKNTRLGE